MNKFIVGGMLAIAMMVGAVGGATVLHTVTANAQTATPAPSASSVLPGDSTMQRSFKSNEDPAHEKGESAEREAQEDAGQKPTVQ